MCFNVQTCEQHWMWRSIKNIIIIIVSIKKNYIRGTIIVLGTMEINWTFRYMYCAQAGTYVRIYYSYNYMTRFSALLFPLRKCVMN